MATKGGETMNGDDDEFDPNMRYVARYFFILFFEALFFLTYGLSNYNVLGTLLNIRMKYVLFRYTYYNIMYVYSSYTLYTHMVCVYIEIL